MSKPGPVKYLKMHVLHNCNKCPCHSYRVQLHGEGRAPKSPADSGPTDYGQVQILPQEPYSPQLDQVRVHLSFGTMDQRLGGSFYCVFSS